MRLAARVVAEPLVAATLPAIWVGSGEGHHAAAVLAAGELIASGDEANCGVPGAELRGPEP